MKRGLEIVVFFCGMILMALEIAGGRLLVFDYGGSVFVWGAIIGVILTGLSLGYYFGGRLADKKPDERILSNIILVSSLFILIIPLVYHRLVLFLSFIPANYGPLTIIFLLFFIPSILLGCVSPFAMKLKTKKIDSIGVISGNLYALATIGSVMGTFLATFVLILFFKIETIFFLLSLTLILVTLVLKKNKKIFFILIVFFVFALIFYNIHSNNNILGGGLNSKDNVQENYSIVSSEKVMIEPLNMVKLPGENVSVILESVYGPVKIKDNGERRSMYISNGVMSEMYINDKFGDVPGWGYLSFMEDLAVSFNTSNALVLGVGAGILCSDLSEKNNIIVDGVDINPVVLKAAKEYFDLEETNLLKIHNEDAREYLKKSDTTYDFIAMDIFKFIDGKYVMPPHLTTQEYFSLVKSHLNENGVFVVMFLREDDVFDSEYKTISSVFENVYFFDQHFKMIVASKHPIKFSEKISMVEKNYTIYSDAIIYTDDYVPIVN